MTDDGKTGGPAPTGQETYYVGIEDEKQMHKSAGNGTMRLARELKHLVKDCPVTAHPDSKDSYYVNSLDDWTKLTIPNEAERQAYGYSPENFKGHFLIYFLKCDWGKCPKGQMTESEFKEKKWEMRVNGKQVKKLSFLGWDAHIAHLEDGFQIAPNSQGVYDIEVKVHEKDSYVEFAAFVIL